MKYGMTEKQFEILNHLIIGPLKSKGAEVFIFGSRATGKHHPHSDVDILYKPSSQLALPSNFLSEIKEAIEESQFPFTVALVSDKDLVKSYRDHVMADVKKL